jgi:peptidoglycan-associated lipoprotein
VNKIRILMGLAIMLALLVGAGCGSKPEPAVEPEPPAEIEEEAQAEEEASSDLARFDDLFNRPEEGDVEEEPAPPPPTKIERVKLEDIHFEFDRYTLTPDARRILSKHARVLKEDPEIRILIEGHCDERGTQEYNLALGQRRAQAAKDYLLNSGVPPGRITVISYGEERPLDSASTEAAWAKNRRAHFNRR